MKNPSTFWAVVLAVLIALGVQNFVIKQTTTPTAASKESAYERVMRTRTLRCAYISWSATYFQKEPNTGKFQGFGYDLAEALAKVMNLKIDWVEEVGVGTMFEGLKTGRYDAICTPIFQDPSGAQHASFSQPSHYSPVYAYARANDARFDINDPKVLDRINDSSVTVVDVEGSNGVEIQKNRYPKAKKLFLPVTTSGAEIMMHVMTKKADITQQIPLVVDDALKNNKGSLKRVSNALTVFPTSPIVVPKGDEKLKEWIDQGIGSMLQMGTIDRILDAYDPHRDKLLRVAPAYRTP